MNLGVGYCLLQREDLLIFLLLVLVSSLCVFVCALLDVENADV